MSTDEMIIEPITGYPAPDTKNPPTYAAGLGELIRAHRNYLGLVARGMAQQLRIDRRDYQRIENGQDDCPPGLMDAIAALVLKFDSQVDAVLDAARRERSHPGQTVVTVEVSADQREEWMRAVVGRAAFEGPLDPDDPVVIMPVVAAPQG